MTAVPAPPRRPELPDRTSARPTPAVIAGHSALECLLTFVLLFGVTTIVRWVAGPSPISDAVPQIRLQLLIIGGCVGLLLVGLILSRPGRMSGGHINPAISLAMWRFGVFPGVSVLPYIVAQLIGSVLGVLAARAVWGAAVENPPVANATLHSGLGWSAGELFAAETATMGLIVYAIGFFLQTPKLAPLVPWLAGLLIAAVIALLGTATGGSVNPARQFGPTMVSGQLRLLWVYLLAPMVGAALAAALLGRVCRHRTVLTHRLCGTHADGTPCDGLSNERCNQSAAFWTQTSRSLLSEWRHAWGAVYRLFRTPEPEKLMELVRDAMTTRCVTVPPYTSLTAVAACMRDDNVGCVMVTHDGALQGIITDRDITVRITAEGLIAGTTTAQQAASKSLVTVVTDATLCEAAALMCMHNFHRLPVVEQGQLVGLLSLGDICETPHAQEILVALSQAEANH